MHPTPLLDEFSTFRLFFVLDGTADDQRDPSISN